MANSNMKQAQQIVRELNIEAQLIPSATNPLNCRFIIIGNQKLKTSQWTSNQLREALEGIKNGCKVESERKETFKANIKNLIPFNCSINETFQEYIKLQAMGSLSTVETWLNSLIDFYCIDDEGNYNTDNIKIAEETAKRLIANKNVMIYKNEYILVDEGIKEVIEEWLKYNDKSKDLLKPIYNKFVDYILNA